MKKSVTLFVFGVLVFSTGWAIRSTFIMHSYENKPIGGGLIAVGLLVMALGVYKLIKS